APNPAGRAVPVWSLAGIGGVLAGAAGLVAPVLRWVRAGAAEVQKQESWVGKLLRRIWKPALNLLLLISIPLFLAGGFVWFATKGAADPPVPGAHSSAGALALWAGLAGGAIVLWLLAWRFSDLNRWSLHAIYEERLGDAFGVERCPPDAPGDPTAAGDEAARTRPTPLQLSQSQPDNLPEVLVCATANEVRYGIAPTARG